MPKTKVIVVCIAAVLFLSLNAGASVCFFGSNNKLLEMLGSYDNVTIHRGYINPDSILSDVSGMCGWVVVYVDSTDASNAAVDWSDASLNLVSRDLPVVWSGYPPRLPCVENSTTMKTVSKARIRVPSLMNFEENVTELSFYEVQTDRGVQQMGAVFFEGGSSAIAFSTNEKNVIYLPFDLSGTPLLLKEIALKYRSYPPVAYADADVFDSSPQLLKYSLEGYREDLNWRDYLFALFFLVVTAVFWRISRLQRRSAGKAAPKKEGRVRRKKAGGGKAGRGKKKRA